jgi:cholesterol transport system auxiliary component
MRARAELLLAACGAALLAGCSGTLLPKPAAAPARHTLDTGAPVPGAAAPPAGAPVLVVALPRAAPGHDSRRMVYLRQAQQLEAFAFHEWVEPPAAMLAPLLVVALQHGGAFRAVLLAPSAVAGTWRLETEQVRLQQDFSTRPSQVRLSLRAVLLDASQRQVIAWREFDTRVAAASDDPAAGVVAAGQATQRLLAAVADFCAGHVRRGVPVLP